MESRQFTWARMGSCLHLRLVHWSGRSIWRVEVLRRESALELLYCPQVIILGDRTMTLGSSFLGRMVDQHLMKLYKIYSKFLSRTNLISYSLIGKILICQLLAKSILKLIIKRFTRSRLLTILIFMLIL